MQIKFDFCSPKEKDIEEILCIIQQAREFLKENGIPQWQDGYPSYQDILEDIKNKYAYCALYEGKIVAYCDIQPYEKDYDSIKGEWKNKESYFAVHRVAVRKENKRQGLTTFLFSQAEKIAKRNHAKSLRVDTHENNKVMQGAVLKNGFEYCGIITLSKNGEERFAYEKVIE